MSKKEIILGGLDCAHCAEVINDKVSKLEEIESCNLNFINKKLTIEIACDLEIDKDDVVSESGVTIKPKKTRNPVKKESSTKTSRRTK